MSFKVGDKVKAFGCEGVVESIQNEMVTVDFVDADGLVFSSIFMPDGKLHEWHKEPSLVLVERAKTKVKLYPALCMWKGKYYILDGLFRDEQEARDNTDKSFIRLLTDDHHAVEVEI